MPEFDREDLDAKHKPGYAAVRESEELLARFCFCCSDRRSCRCRGPFYPRGTKEEAAASASVGEWHSDPAHTHDHPQSQWHHDRHYRAPTLVSRSGNGSACRLPWY
jgi:hypothetical protein